MELEEAIKIIKDIDTLDDYELQEAIGIVIGELFAMQNLLDEKNEEIENLQKENDLAKKALIANSYEADERNNLLVKIQELQKENEKLKEIDLTTVHIKGVCDEKERWRNKIREKIEEIKARMNDDCLALHEFQRIAKIDVLQDLLKEE